jgi:hypothetical protein
MCDLSDCKGTIAIEAVLWELLSSFRKADNRANYKAHLTQLKAQQTFFRSVPGRKAREGTREGGKEAGARGMQ